MSEKIENINITTNPLKIEINGKECDISNTVDMDIHIERGIVTVSENIKRTYTF